MRYDIYCFNCGNAIRIKEPLVFFNTPVQICLKCNSAMKTFQSGLEEQIILSVTKAKSLHNAVKLYERFYGTSFIVAKNQVVEFLNSEGVKLPEKANLLFRLLVYFIIIYFLVSVLAGLYSFISTLFN